MEKRVNYAVVKEKIIKTDELLKFYEDKNSKLIKLGRAFNEVKSKYETSVAEVNRLRIENDRLNFTLETLKPKFEQNELELHELKEDHTRLEERYQQVLMDSQNEYKDLELKISQCICSDVSPFKSPKTQSEEKKTEKMQSFKEKLQEFKDMENKLKKANAAIIIKDKQLAEEIEKQKKIHSVEIQKLYVKNDGLHKEINKLKAKVSQMELDLSKAKVDKTSSLELVISSLECEKDFEVKKLQKQVRRLSVDRTEIRRLKSECEDLKLKLSPEKKDCLVQTDNLLSVEHSQCARKIDFQTPNGIINQNGNIAEEHDDIGFGNDDYNDTDEKTDNPVGDLSDDSEIYKEFCTSRLAFDRRLLKDIVLSPMSSISDHPGTLTSFSPIQESSESILPNITVTPPTPLDRPDLGFNNLQISNNSDRKETATKKIKKSINRKLATTTSRRRKFIMPYPTNFLPLRGMRTISKKGSIRKKQPVGASTDTILEALKVLQAYDISFTISNERNTNIAALQKQEGANKPKNECLMEELNLNCGRHGSCSQHKNAVMMRSCPGSTPELVGFFDAKAERKAENSEILLQKLMSELEKLVEQRNTSKAAPSKRRRRRNDVDFPTETETEIERLFVGEWQDVLERNRLLREAAMRARCIDEESDFLGDSGLVSPGTSNSYARIDTPESLKILNHQTNTTESTIGCPIDSTNILQTAASNSMENLVSETKVPTERSCSNDESQLISTDIKLAANASNIEKESVNPANIEIRITSDSKNAKSSNESLTYKRTSDSDSKQEKLLSTLEMFDSPCESLSEVPLDPVPDFDKILIPEFEAKSINSSKNLYLSSFTECTNQDLVQIAHAKVAVKENPLKEESKTIACNENREKSERLHLSKTQETEEESQNNRSSTSFSENHSSSLENNDTEQHNVINKIVKENDKALGTDHPNETKDKAVCLTIEIKIEGLKEERSLTPDLSETCQKIPHLENHCSSDSIIAKAKYMQLREPSQNSLDATRSFESSTKNKALLTPIKNMHVAISKKEHVSTDTSINLDGTKPVKITPPMRNLLLQEFVVRSPSLKLLDVPDSPYQIIHRNRLNSESSTKSDFLVRSPHFRLKHKQRIGSDDSEYETTPEKEKRTTRRTQILTRRRLRTSKEDLATDSDNEGIVRKITPFVKENSKKCKSNESSSKKNSLRVFRHKGTPKNMDLSTAPIRALRSTDNRKVKSKKFVSDSEDSFNVTNSGAKLNDSGCNFISHSQILGTTDDKKIKSKAFVYENKDTRVLRSTDDTKVKSKEFDSSLNVINNSDKKLNDTGYKVPSAEPTQVLRSTNDNKVKKEFVTDSEDSSLKTLNSLYPKLNDAAYKVTPGEHTRVLSTTDNRKIKSKEFVSDSEENENSNLNAINNSETKLNNSSYKVLDKNQTKTTPKMRSYSLRSSDQNSVLNKDLTEMGIECEEDDKSLVLRLSETEPKLERPRRTRSKLNTSNGGVGLATNIRITRSRKSCDTLDKLTPVQPESKPKFESAEMRKPVKNTDGSNVQRRSSRIKKKKNLAVCEYENTSTEINTDSKENSSFVEKIKNETYRKNSMSNETVPQQARATSSDYANNLGIGKHQQNDLSNVGDINKEEKELNMEVAVSSTPIKAVIIPNSPKVLRSKIISHVKPSPERNQGISSAANAISKTESESESESSHTKKLTAKIKYLLPPLGSNSENLLSSKCENPEECILTTEKVNRRPQFASESESESLCNKKLTAKIIHHFNPHDFNSENSLSEKLDNPEKSIRTTKEIDKPRQSVSESEGESLKCISNKKLTAKIINHFQPPQSILENLLIRKFDNQERFKFRTEKISRQQQSASESDNESLKSGKKLTAKIINHFQPHSSNLRNSLHVNFEELEKPNLTTELNIGQSTAKIIKINFGDANFKSLLNKELKHREKQDFTSDKIKCQRQSITESESKSLKNINTKELTPKITDHFQTQNKEKTDLTTKEIIKQQKSASESEGEIINGIKLTDEIINHLNINDKTGSNRTFDNKKKMITKSESESLSFSSGCETTPTKTKVKILSRVDSATKSNKTERNGSCVTDLFGDSSEGEPKKQKTADIVCPKHELRNMKIKEGEDKSEKIVEYDTSIQEIFGELSSESDQQEDSEIDQDHCKSNQEDSDSDSSCYLQSARDLITYRQPTGTLREKILKQVKPRMKISPKTKTERCENVSKLPSMRPIDRVYQDKTNRLKSVREAKKISFKCIEQNNRALKINDLEEEQEDQRSKINIVQDIRISREGLVLDSDNETAASQTGAVNCLSIKRRKIEETKISNETDIVSKVLQDMIKNKLKPKAKLNIFKPANNQIINRRQHATGNRPVTNVPARFVKNKPAEMDDYDCPKSPDIVEVPDAEYLPKIIPEEQRRLMAPSQVRVFINKLLIYSKEENVLDEIVAKFATQEDTYIAEIILQKVSQDFHNKPDPPKPPAPPLTTTQQVLLGFMARLVRSTHPNIYDKYLRAAELYLFNKSQCQLKSVVAVTRLYTAICKLHRNLNRMRRFCCEGFYFMGDNALPMFFTVLTMWGEILPTEVNCADFPLAKVLVQLCYLKTCNQPGYNLLPLRSLLHKYFGYPSERWNCDHVFQEILIQYLRDPALRLSDFTVLLFLKNKPTKWVYQKLRENIMPIVESIPMENCNLKATLIILLGNICFNFIGEQYDVTVIKAMGAWFDSINKNIDADPILKKSIAIAKSRLTKVRQKKKEKKVNTDNQTAPEQEPTKSTHLTLVEEIGDDSNEELPKSSTEAEPEHKTRTTIKRKFIRYRDLDEPSTESPLPRITEPETMENLSERQQTSYLGVEDASRLADLETESSDVVRSASCAPQKRQIININDLKMSNSSYKRQKVSSVSKSDVEIANESCGSSKMPPNTLCNTETFEEEYNIFLYRRAKDYKLLTPHSRH